LFGAVAELQDIFGGGSRIQVEFLACPLRDNTVGRGRRESPVLGLTTEVHLNGDMPAPVAMYMVVPFDFEHLKRKVHINRGVFVGAVFDLVRLC
jgi:hypothetical protein